MPYCANCGTEVEGRFCAKCGTPVGAAAPPGAATAGANPLPPPAATGLADNLAGALCYLGLLITGILFLVLEPYNKNRAIRFHAMQAILLNIAWIVVWFVLNIVLVAIHLGVLLTLVWLAFVALWIYMIVTTYQGKTVVLPVIGPLAQGQA
jgi:uncharacterized membrane protein